MIEGEARDADPVEAALVDLARKSVEAPALLEPADLAELRRLVGDGAIDYTVVLGAFHYINRIADLLHVDPEALPESLRRFEFLRRASVRMAAFMFRKFDLGNRKFDKSFEEVRDEYAAVHAAAGGGDVGEPLAPLHPRPAVIEILRLALEERTRRSSLDGETLARVARGVEEALPARAAEATGFHARPADPVDAFVFVGTRYAARTTQAMVDALRDSGYDDLRILDLANAIADANQWARMRRLLGLQAGLMVPAEAEGSGVVAASAAGA